MEILENSFIFEWEILIMKQRKQEGIQLSLFDEADFGVSDIVAPLTGSKTKKQVSGKKRTEKNLQVETTLVGDVIKQILEDKNAHNDDIMTGEKEVLKFGSKWGMSGFNHTELFTHLAQSDFRRSFHLKLADKEYIRKKGLETIQKHAADFVAKRLAPAFIPNDGKQTPMRGHPVFIAQHATACCCRGCFAKWHHIPQGRQLTIEEQAYAVDVLMSWIRKEYLS